MFQVSVWMSWTLSAVPGIAGQHRKCPVNVAQPNATTSPFAVIGIQRPFRHACVPAWPKVPEQTLEVHGSPHQAGCKL